MRLLKDLAYEVDQACNSWTFMHYALATYAWIVLVKASLFWVIPAIFFTFLMPYFGIGFAINQLVSFIGGN